MRRPCTYFRILAIAAGLFAAVQPGNAQPSCGGWTRTGPDQASPPTSTTYPARRTGASCCYDSTGHRVFIFGGETGNGVDKYNDLWAYAGGTWTRFVGPDAPGSPSRRERAGMVFDSARNKLVLFGGVGSPNGNLDVSLGDTWEFDLASETPTWSQVFPSLPRPAARFGFAMAYDQVRHVTVMVAGHSYAPAANPASTPYGDTWIYNGQRWTQVADVPQLTRDETRMTFDSSRGVCVLFGGQSGNNALGDTWEWNGSVWSQSSPGGAPNEPAARSDFAVVFDTLTSSTLLFGGSNLTPTGRYNDLHEYTGAGALGWTVRSVLTAPPPGRANPCMAFDTFRQRTVLFGGNPGGNNSLNDTWEFWSGHPLSIVSSPPNVATIALQTTVFSIGVTGTPAPTYQWQRNGVNLTDGPTGTGSIVSGARTSSLVISGTRAADAGSFRCVVTSDCGTLASSPALLTVVCRSDFNGSGGVSVQDIFDFLAAYFAGC